MSSELEKHLYMFKGYYVEWCIKLVIRIEMLILCYGSDRIMGVEREPDYILS